MISQSISPTPLAELSGDAHTDPAFSVTGARFPVGILTAVLMPLRAMRFSRFLMSAVCLRIGLILTRSAPIQILQMIVVAIVIAMQGPHSRWSSSDEGCQNEAMNGRGSARPATREDNLPIRTSRSSVSSLIGRLRWSQHLAFDCVLRIPPISHSSVQGSHSTMIRYFITGKVGYGEPSFVAIHNNEPTRLRRAVTP
jgi:hypothetical protein